MQELQSSGWRALKPVIVDTSTPAATDKPRLVEAARLAAKALSLTPSQRFVLEQLCYFFGGKLVENRIMVWPSNEAIMERTNLSERSVRRAIERLRAEGIIDAKDSPNQKRFAQRSPSGEILRVYGFDLTPLLNRAREFEDIVFARKEMQRERDALFDQLTIHRRSAQEALRALSDFYPDCVTAELTERAHELLQRTPKRSFTGSIEGVTGEWEMVRQEAETLYFTASAGQDDRHIDRNKPAEKDSCNNGIENEGSKRRAMQMTARELADLCPDAVDMMGAIRSDRDLVAGAETVRGWYGVSPSAWEEARREIGPLPAAATLVYVIQLQTTPGATIGNLGGYFRAMCRLVRDGRVNLEAEIRRRMRN